MPRKLILCRCEDVTSADVERAVAAGHEDLEEVKRYTGFGTGPCQGKECLRAVALAVVAASGARAEELQPLQPFTARPPLAPTELKWFAAARRTPPASTVTVTETETTSEPIGAPAGRERGR